MHRSAVLPGLDSLVRSDAPGAANDTVLAILTFMVAGQSYGLSVMEVVQIIEMVTITHLPRTPQAIQGIINVRGQIVPVLDLRLRFGLEAQPYRLHTPIILTDYQAHTLGIIVDQMGEVLVMSPEKLKPAEAILPPDMVNPVIADNGLTYLAGVGQVVRRMIPILHLPAILSVTERTQLLAALAEQPEIGENS
jgi:purine-binding chemotaxis protein CheW